MDLEDVVLGERWQSQKTPNESTYTKCPEKASVRRRRVRGGASVSRNLVLMGTGLLSGGDESVLKPDGDGG